MQEAQAASAGPGGAAPAAPPAAAKPYLRSGSGWAARVTAAREGRRYVPRGGPVKDYSKEDEVQLPRRAARGRAAAPTSRIPRSPTKSAASSAGAGSSGYSARRQVAASNTSTSTCAASRLLRPAALGRAPGPAAPTAPAAVAHTRLPTSESSQQQRHPPAAGPQAQPANDHWARKLLQGGLPQLAVQPPQHQQHPNRDARQAQQEVALKEFEALESQVLREVGNSPLHSPSGSKKAAAAFGGGSASLLNPGRSTAGTAPNRGPAAGENSGVSTHVAQMAVGQHAQGQDEEDVFQSDGEGGVRCASAEDAHMQAAAAGIAHPLARRAVSFGPAGGFSPRGSTAGAAGGHVVPRQQGPPVYCEDDEVELEAESSFQDRPPAQHVASSLVQRYFTRPAAPPAAVPCQPQGQRNYGQQQYEQQHYGQQQYGQHPPQPALPPASAQSEEAAAVEQLQQEVVRLQEERARVARLRMELEEATVRLEGEKAAFEKRKMEEAARFQGERAEELRKLQRDRRVLEKQSRAIMKLPTKQFKEEVAAVEALLAEERKVGRAREARHKLSTERLRQQVLELQGRNTEMREQIRFLEQQRLEQQGWGGGSGGAPGEPGAPADVPAAAPTKGRSSTAARQEAQQRQPGGLPAVKVERGGSSGAPAAMSAAAVGASRRQLQPQSMGQQQQTAGSWGGGEEEEDEYGEPLISDVQLGEEQVVTVCEEPEGHLSDSSSMYHGQYSTVDSGSGGVYQGAPSGAAWHDAGPSGEQQAGGQLGAGAPGAGPVSAGVAATDAMGKASSALARFNALRASLAQHEGLQSRLASRISSLQASPQLGALPGPPAGSATNMVAAAVAVHAPEAIPSFHSSALEKGTQDDLRRLGRTLLAAAPAPVGATAAPAAAQPQQLAVLPGAPGDSVVTEVQHADGRWKRLYGSGLREQCFANGSVKQQVPAGASLTRFANGDIKKALPCGTVEYYYGEVNSWQVTHPSGVEVYFFPSGQVEAHHPGGVKEILFGDGAVRKVLPDGRELAISAAHLSREIQQAQPDAHLLLQ